MNSFKQLMDQQPSQKVASMTHQLNQAFKNRETYERQKNPLGSHIELNSVKRQLVGNALVARFLCTLKADPDIMLNKQRKAGYRANLKAIRKIRMLAEYMAGKGHAINGVCKALFAATILANKFKMAWLSNAECEKILAQMDLKEFPEELRLSIEEFNKTSISDPMEVRNQACQFRTAFENLGIYFMTRDDADNNNNIGIYGDMANPLMQDLAVRWGLVEPDPIEEDENDYYYGESDNG